MYDYWQDQPDKQHVNDKKTVLYSPLRNLGTLAYLVSLLIKNNIKVYSSKAALDTLSANIMKPIILFFRKDTKD